MNTNQEHSSEVKTETQNWSAYCHLSAVLGLVVPFGTIMGPFLIWSMKKTKSEEVMAEGKDAMNFQITTLILTLPLWLLSGRLLGTFDAFMAVYYLRYSVSVLAIGLSAIKGYKLMQREPFRYPINFKIIK